MTRYKKALLAIVAASLICVLAATAFGIAAPSASAFAPGPSTFVAADHATRPADRPPLEHVDSPAERIHLYRTRHGAFFLWEQYVTPADNLAHEIVPFTDEKAQEWLEKHANELVEQYFGEMPEGGAAERRLTLRLPNNLAKKLEEIAESKGLPVNRYINRCLEECAAEEGKTAPVI